VAIGGAGGRIPDRARGTDDALHAAKVVADDGSGRERDGTRLEGFFQALE